jgi:putative drug exporter of the RND superfamily
MQDVARVPGAGGFFAAVAGFAVRFRVLVVLGWLVVTVAAMLALPGLGSEVNSDPSLFLPASAPSVRAASLAAPLLGGASRSKVTIVAARASTPLTSADLAAAGRVAGLARQVSGVTAVRAGAISPDRHAAEIDVTVGQNAADVAALKPVVRHLQDALASAGPPPGLQLHLAGPVAANVASNASGNKATGRIGMFAVLFIVVALLVLLRSPVAALVTFLPSVAALLVAEKFTAGLGAHGLQISSVTQTLLVVLILGAGTDYGLFLIYRFREELRAGTGAQPAVVAALTRVGASITASAGTVILALLTLLLASFGLYRDLAVPLALGIAVMLLAGLTLLPALLALTASWMFRGLSPGGGAREQGGWWGRVAARAVRRPAPVLGAGVLVFAALALAALGYRTANVSKSANPPAGSDAAVGNALVARYFTHATANPAGLILRYGMPVWQQPGPLATASASLRSSGLFTVLTGPLDANGAPLSPALYARLHAELGNPRALPLAEPASGRVTAGVYNAYRATGQFVSADGRTVRFAAGLRAGNQQSTAAMDAVPAVRSALTTAARRSGAVASGLVGRAASLYDVSNTAGSDMVRIIPVAVLAIAVLLGVVLRSLVAPLYLVASIAASFLAALGLTTLLAIDLGGQDGLIFVLPFLMFVFLLALGEDYNILVMTRIREEAAALPVREAVVAAISRTGPTITSAGLILAGTFGVLGLFGGGVMGGQLQAIGLGLALGILLDTFGVRTLLVPSAAVLLGRWNWWPSRMSRPAPGRPGGAGGTPLTPVASDNAG